MEMYSAQLSIVPYFCRMYYQQVILILVDTQDIYNLTLAKILVLGLFSGVLKQLMEMHNFIKIIQLLCGYKVAQVVLHKWAISLNLDPYYLTMQQEQFNGILILGHGIYVL